MAASKLYIFSVIKFHSIATNKQFYIFVLITPKSTIQQRPIWSKYFHLRISTLLEKSSLDGCAHVWILYICPLDIFIDSYTDIEGSRILPAYIDLILETFFRSLSVLFAVSFVHVRRDLLHETFSWAGRSKNITLGDGNVSYCDPEKCALCTWLLALYNRGNLLKHR